MNYRNIVIIILALLLTTSCDKYRKGIQFNTYLSYEVDGYSIICSCDFDNSVTSVHYNDNYRTGLEYNNHSILLVSKDNQKYIVLNNLLYEADNVEFTFYKDRQLFMISSENVFYDITEIKDGILFSNLIICMGNLNIKMQ